MTNAATDAKIVLKHLPLVLYVELGGIMTKQFPGLPQNWFPMHPITGSWKLDKHGNIDIQRRAFPMVPDFSSTIHCATGRTIHSIIADLGSMKDRVSFAAAMRGYIALSRTTDAEGLLVARPFLPVLFRQGPQFFPTVGCPPRPSAGE